MSGCGGMPGRGTHVDACLAFVGLRSYRLAGSPLNASPCGGEYRQSTLDGRIVRYQYAKQAISDHNGT